MNIPFEKHWKTIAIVIAIVTIAITGTIFIMNVDIKPIEKYEVVDQEVKEFLISDKRKLREIFLTQELFEKLEPPEGYVIYYFPEECPEYTEDILMIENTEYGKKYFLPEKNSLVKIPKEHEWSKEFKLFWKKSPSETTVYNPAPTIKVAYGGGYVNLPTDTLSPESWEPLSEAKV